MIFLGDVAHPFPSRPVWMASTMPWDVANAVVINLEGPVVRTTEPYTSKKIIFNHESLFSNNSLFGVRAACLANNHVTDVGGGVCATRRFLHTIGISSFGAGNNLGEALEPAEVHEDGHAVALLGFGWKTIQCKIATAELAGVAPLDPETMFAALARIVDAGDDREVIVQVHWNYEMEGAPQPAHRQLAMALIDRGAAAIVGHHPHCASGVEIYRGKPIVYSLGNWWMPQGVYLNGQLSYGPESRLQLAFEWHPAGRFRCHWFNYSPADHSISWVSSEEVESSRYVNELTPYAGMDHAAYRSWFRSHRRKRKLLPIYSDMGKRRSNRLKDIWVEVRHAGVVQLKRISSVRASRR